MTSGVKFGLAHSSDILEVSLCQTMTDAIQMTADHLQSKCDVQQDSDDNLLIEINSSSELLNLNSDLIEEEILDADVSY